MLPYRNNPEPRYGFEMRFGVHQVAYREMSLLYSEHESVTGTYTRDLVRVSVPLRATYRPGPRIVVLYAEAGSGRAILMNDGLGKYERQRVLRTQRDV